MLADTRCHAAGIQDAPNLIRSLCRLAALSICNTVDFTRLKRTRLTQTKLVTTWS